MEQDGHLKTLAERMKEKAEQERIETEKIFTEQLLTLKDNLQESSKNALHTMSNAMAAEVTAVQKDLTIHYRILLFAFGKKWICLATLSMAIFLGVLAGGWGMVKAGAWHLSSYRAELKQLKRDCQEQRQTLVDLKGETWGLELRTLEDGRFIVFPFGKKPDYRAWTVGGLSAIKMEE